jgi:hypothetical protein
MSYQVRKVNADKIASGKPVVIRLGCGFRYKMHANSIGEYKAKVNADFQVGYSAG